MHICSTVRFLLGMTLPLFAAACSSESESLDGPSGATDAGTSDGADAKDATTDTGGGGDAGEASVVDEGPPKGQIGAPCSSGEECASGICLEIGRCTDICSDATDCPISSNWQCGVLPGQGKICQCMPTGPQEVCNGIDDDCSAFIDEGDPCEEPGMTCEYGSCVCPPENQCGDGCVDTQTDPSHCGRCDRECPSTCTDGECDCPSGLSPCDVDWLVECHDLQNEDNHCGTCDQACSELESCQAGSCECYGIDATQCAGECRDLDVAMLNCGTCGVECPAGPNDSPAMCAGGTCTYAEEVAWLYYVTNVYDFAVDDTTIYVPVDGSLRTVAKADGTIKDHALPSGSAGSRALALGGGYLYRLFTSSNPGEYRIMRYEIAYLDDPAPPADWYAELEVGTASGGRSLEIVGSKLYYTIETAAGEDWQLRSLPLAGGASELVHQTSRRVIAMAADGTNAYLLKIDPQDTDNLHIWRVPLSGGAEVEIATEPLWYGGYPSEGGGKVSNGMLYYQLDHIARAIPLSGGAPTTVLSDFSPVTALAFDDSYIYWAARANGSRLRRTPR